jgi:TatD DNase family protein
MKVIDTHCHLTDRRLGCRLEEVLARACEAGVGKMICSASDVADSHAAAEIAAAHEGVYFTAGVHPHEAKNAAAGYLDELAALVGHEKNVAIGEIGLDYHYDFSPRDAQHRMFSEQLALAGRLGKAIVVHTREAFEDTMAILAEQGADWERLVFHSFTAGPAEVRQLVERRCYVSFSGILTFKNAADVRSAAALVPPDRLLVETDAPYLTPEPMRHIKTNEPANVVHVLARLAQVLGQPAEELAERILENALRFLRI